MHTIMDPTAGMFAECIGVPTDVLTTEDITADITDLMDIIARTITGLIVGMCVEFIVVHTGGVITDDIVSNGRLHSARNSASPGAGALCDVVGPMAMQGPNRNP